MDWKPKLFVAQNEVLTSGTVLCHNGEPIEIAPNYVLGVSNLYRVRLVFLDDPSNALTANVLNKPENLVEVQLQNFGGSQPSSTSRPLIVGRVSSKNILLSLACFSIGPDQTKLRIVSYTLMLGA
jgi:hypothetical protein